MSMLGYGTKLQRLVGASWTDIAYITSLGGPELDRDDVDVTHMQSPNAVREYIAGLGDAGELSIEGNMVPSDTSQQRLIDDYTGRVVASYRMLLPDAVDDANKTRWTFEGYVKSYSQDTPTDDKISFSATIKIAAYPLLTSVMAADLTALAISEGTLTPAFAGTTYEYVATVANATSSMTVTPACAAADAILVNGVVVATGDPSGAIALSVGANTIVIEVQEDDKASTYYGITVGRESA